MKILCLLLPWLFLATCVCLGGVVAILCPDVDPELTPEDR